MQSAPMLGQLCALGCGLSPGQSHRQLCNPSVAAAGCREHPRPPRCSSAGQSTAAPSRCRQCVTRDSSSSWGEVEESGLLQALVWRFPNAPQGLGRIQVTYTKGTQLLSHAFTKRPFTVPMQIAASSVAVGFFQLIVVKQDHVFHRGEHSVSVGSTDPYTRFFSLFRRSLSANCVERACSCFRVCLETPRAG